ncbi:MAG: methionine--tRNA ligase subunit beta [Candidatus Margulisbacteria bacterium]|jgi:methionyl-tRNA synthetase|nr:methionine--tRNA ligase subunit beta [Candidatus Margulisiibacteriota bacterium]
MSPDNITFDEFRKLDLRVAQIRAVEEIAGADKLYKLQIDLGSEQRELVAGIKLHYRPDELIGRKIIVLANLEPRAIRGVTSHGMLLAAANEDKSAVVLLTVEKDLPVGAKVS